jgi:hypothetical protein
MLLEKNEKKKLIITIAVILFGVTVLAIAVFNKYRGGKSKLTTIENKAAGAQSTEDSKKDITTIEGGIVQGDIIVMPTIDFNDIKNNKRLKELMVSRKKSLGIKKSLDMIVRSDESFTIGDVHISMRDILEKAFIQKGEVFQEEIEDSGAVRPQKIKEYGIYVVRSGDNIWNIHFNILKEFYDYQGINVSSQADEPGDRGMSSGVGKILKFSETLVIIYNLIEKRVDSDINLLKPLSKIIIYNMDEVFSLLQEINYENMARIQFDGKNIWIPAKKL